ncbi:MAG TPA: bifunctional DNA-formamidopyrimidine glycosylase/DNA-(apurinic or apyrimidinic site) lyase [Rhizomicrobium sp.]
MPELPEVETVRRGLAPVLEHHRFTHVETRRGDLRRPFPPDFVQRLQGRTVSRLWRRAKYLLADLDSGETLVVHLGMSGRVAIHTRELDFKPGAQGDPGRGKHDHVVFETDAPARIVFTDHRRFGLMTIVDTETLDTNSLFKGIGVEPLSKAFDAARLRRALEGKRTPIKSALLDQRVVAGLGNIYVCEALFRARISPKRSAAGISADRAALLVATIKAVLKDAIKAGGSSLRDYAKADGALGEFQHRFAVYGRAGRRCGSPGCPGTVKRIVQAGRSTFYCPSCQR